MRPEKLVMENFGPFAGRAELDFSKLEDIFLISGKTGSGKTTIFDAVCFALYGDVPGARSGHLGRLRSDHAGEDADCVVRLDFSLGLRPGGRIYTVERKLRRELKKKRGGGTSHRDEIVILWENFNGKETVLGGKKSEVNRKIVELVGLEADEFFKIVLLPQGEFAEFLRQNTNERQKVLGKLFPIEKARAVKEAAAGAAAEAQTRAEETRLALESLQNRAGPHGYEGAHKKAQAAFEEAKKKLRDLGNAETVLLRTLSLRQAEEDVEKRLRENRGQEQRILAGEEAIAEKRGRLARSRSARPLGEFLRSWKGAKKNSEEVSAALLRAAEERAGARRILESIEGREEENLRQEQELLGLRERRPALVELQKEEEELKREGEELEKNRGRLAELEQGQAEVREEQSRQEGRIAAVEALTAEGPSLDNRIEETRNRLDLWKKRRFLAERRENLEGNRQTLDARIGELEDRRQDLEKRIPLMTEEIEGLRREQARAEQADMAAVLAQNLAEGEPCPVCGSTLHPRPAAAWERRFSLKERIEGMDKSLRDLDRLLSAALGELEAKRTEAGRIAEELRRQDQEMEETGEPAALPDTAAIDRDINELVRELNGLLAKQQKVRDAVRTMQKVYRQKEEGQKVLEETGRELAALREGMRNLESRIAEKEERRRELPVPPRGSGSGAAEALAALDKAVAALDQSLARRRREREEAGRSLAAAQAAEQAALRHREQAAERLEAAKTALDRELAASPFSGAQEAEESLLDQGAEDELDREIRAWGEEKAGMESQKAELAARVREIRLELDALELPEHCVDGPSASAGAAMSADTDTDAALSAGADADASASAKDPGGTPDSKKTPGSRRMPGLAEAEQLLADLRNRREQEEGERDQAFAELSRLERDRKEMEDLQRRYEGQAAKAGELRALADDLAGKNPLRQPFDSWLLGSYLAEIAGYATTRLEKMSEHRYSLLPESQRQPGQRGYAGLDLSVFDAHTGKTRPCATLSGGESFLASISLALGLADSIQTRSGGVRLDAVFIDEGFGSLDEASLDKALLILDELRDHRMVGLISHVGDMGSRIPCRIEVVKTGSGSRILA
ncbi:MAG: AAA family ATPase [Treponema sp.]|jgi:exonuclease SbcC|nr:AAA family ATPase [Treponema sp.]